ncbi:MAG TPA: hypothetical protein VK601_23505, partial [Kofleriaceae bacterium]|nr:hypothetical protein [Kofleriaceae bacterium]
MIRIKLRYEDVEAMVQRFAANVGKSGLFLPTRSLQPIGAEIKFELRLADDSPALVGLGRVRSAVAPDPQHPRAAFGMAVELMRVTPQSRGLILRMLEHRRAAGLPEVGLPTAADIDAARRSGAVDAAGRDLVTGPVPVIAEPVAAAVAVPPPAPIDPPPGEALLTAPRRATGPMTVAKVAAIAPLAPEPPRRRRIAVSEVIERASGPVASASIALPGLDDDVDIAATIARARALAGGSLDADLEALCEIAAAPLEISIEAASAELARQLGGSAVRRDRSAGWAPPPATAIATAVADAPAAPERDVAEPDAIEPAAVEPAAVEPAAVEPAAVEPSQPLPVETSDEEHVEIALAELDNDEHTEMGDMPGGAAGFELPEDADEFGDDEAGLGQLTVAEDGPGYPGSELPLELGVDEFDDFEILAEADAGDADLLASHGEHDASGEHHRPVELDPGDLGDLGDPGDPGDPGDAVVGRPSELDFASRLDLGDDSDLYLGSPSDEFSARHVIDLLGDELTGQHAGAGPGGRIGRSPAPDPHLLSAGAALAAFETDDPDDPGDPADPDDDSRVTDDPDAYDSQARVRPIFEMDPSSSFTLAGIPSDSIDL